MRRIHILGKKGIEGATRIFIEGIIIINAYIAFPVKNVNGEVQVIVAFPGKSNSWASGMEAGIIDTQISLSGDLTVQVGFALLSRLGVHPAFTSLFGYRDYDVLCAQ
jgi:hypothetical protein